MKKLAYNKKIEELLVEEKRHFYDNQGVLKSYARKLKDYARSHIVESTAILAATTPIWAGLETIVLGMSDEVSLNARLLGVAMTYGGLGALVVKGRDLYRKCANINDSSKERTQQLHDTIYSTLANLAIAPPFYLASGVREPAQIIGGTLCAMCFGVVSGSLIGYAIDMYRGLTGIKASQRLPQFIKKKGSKFKLGIAAMLTAASLALTAGIYAISPEKHKTVQTKQKVTSEIEYHDDKAVETAKELNDPELLKEIKTRFEKISKDYGK